MAKVTNVGTRTRADVAAKDTAKAELTTVARATVDLCHAWPNMTNEKRTTLQIPVRSTSRTPSPVPATAPQVMAAITSAISICVSARNVEDTTRRAKPAGVSSRSAR